VSPNLWQALLAVSQSPVDAGWLGIAFALGVVASCVVVRWRADGDAAAAPVEDDELAFVEQLVGRASTPPAAAPRVLARGASLPPPLPPPLLQRRSCLPRPPEEGLRPPAEAVASLPGEDQSTVIDLKWSDLLDQLESEVGSHAGSEDVEEDRTRSWSRSELLQELAIDREPPLSTVAPLCLAERPRRAASLRGVDVAAARRRLEHGGRA
jgi:hypothetical protein